MNKKDSLIENISKKQETLDMVNNQVLENTNQLIDANEDERVELLKKRQMLLTEKDSLIDEIKILTQRRKRDYLNPFEENLDQAYSQVNELQEKSNVKRKLLSELLNNLRKLRNSSHWRFSRESNPKELIDLETQITKERIESNLISRDLARAVNLVNRCKMDIENAKNEDANW